MTSTSLTHISAAGHAAALAQSYTADGPRADGLYKGAQVITLDGIRPVESLRAGDRIVTRSGARVLRDLVKDRAHYRLSFDRPQIVLLSEGQVHSETGVPFAA